MGEWKNYFVYTKRERMAVVSLLLLSFALLAIPHLFEPPLVPAAVSLKEPVVEIPPLEAGDASTTIFKDEVAGNWKSDRKLSVKRFFFDPNSAGADELQSLGISQKAASVIIHYREKGGRFRKPQDLAKVYSIPKSLCAQLLPFVRIQSAEPTPTTRPQSEDRHVTTMLPKSPSTKILDINTAFQEDWEELPGIGPTLAKRIITFRERLGGFVSVNQVQETYGVADSVFRYIIPRLVCGSPVVKTIDLNTATVDELKLHPYFRGHLAYAIVRYREQHGRFGSMEDLQKLQGMTDSARIKITPYLAIKSP